MDARRTMWFLAAFPIATPARARHDGRAAETPGAETRRRLAAPRARAGAGVPGR